MAQQIPLEKPNNQNTPSLPILLEPSETSQLSSSSSPKSPKNGRSSSEGVAALDGQDSAGVHVAVDQEAMNVSDEALAVAAADEESGRERLQRHRVEVAGQVWIPDIWDQEELLQDWIDCSAFDASLFPSGIMSARSALVEEGRRQNSGRLRIENRC